MANTEKQICSQCGAPLDTNLTVCKYCGAEIAVRPQTSAPQQHQQYTQQSNQYVQQPNNYTQQSNQYVQRPNNNYTQQSSQYSTSQYTQQTHTYVQEMHTQVQQAPPQYVPPQASAYSQPATYHTQNNVSGYYPYKQKSKVLAGVLAIIFGGLGIHKFYTGHIGWGIVYLLFSWTYIPTIVGFVEGIIYLCASNEYFNMKYVKHKN